MVFTKASRAEIAQVDKQWAWKFAIRSLLFVFCVISIGCISWTATRSTRIFWWPSFTIILLMVPLMVSIVWGIVSVIILAVRKRPAHPGFAVSFDLLLWLSLIVTGLFFTTFAALSLPQEYGYGYEDYYGYGSSRHHRNKAVQAEGHQIALVAIVGAAFMDISIILHFVLFVWACVDTHRYNRENAIDRLAEARTRLIISEMRERGEIFSPSTRDAAPVATEQPYNPAQDYQTREMGASTYDASMAQSRYNAGEVPRIGLERNIGGATGTYGDEIQSIGRV